VGRDGHAIVQRSVELQDACVPLRGTIDDGNTSEDESTPHFRATEL